LTFPVDSVQLTSSLSSKAEGGVSHEAVESLLQKFAIQDFIRLDITYWTSTSEVTGNSSLS